MKSIEVMRDLRLLDWRSLLVGWRRGWVSRDDVFGHAVNQLLAEVPDPDLKIAMLAAGDSENYSNADLEDLLVAISARHGAPIPATVLAQLSEWQPSGEIDNSVRREFEQWRLAHLVSAAREARDREDLLNRLEKIWVGFGYPDDMRAVSRYPLDAQDQATPSPVRIDRALKAAEDTIERLKRSVGQSH